MRRPICQLSALMLCSFTTGPQSFIWSARNWRCTSGPPSLQRDLHVLDAALDGGLAQRLRQRIAETIDDGARRAPGRERAPPGVGLKPGKPLSIAVWDVRQARDAGRAGLREPAQLVAR